LLTLKRNEFLVKAKKIYKNKYNYSEVKYIKSGQKIKIFCKKHNVYFYQTANYHLQQKGCTYCIKEELGSKTRKTKKQFIKEARAIHGYKYIYKNIIYKNNKTNVEIICKLHGSFWQLPSHHLKGSGCLNCASTGFNTNKPAILYYLKI